MSRLIFNWQTGERITSSDDVTASEVRYLVTDDRELALEWSEQYGFEGITTPELPDDQFPFGVPSTVYCVLDADVYGSDAELEADLPARDVDLVKDDGRGYGHRLHLSPELIAKIERHLDEGESIWSFVRRAIADRLLSRIGGETGEDD